MAKSKARTGGKSRNSKAQGKGTWKRVLLGFAVLLVLLMIPAGMALWSLRKLAQPYQGYPGTERLVTIEPGLGASQILDRLQEEGVLVDAKLARTYLIYRMGDPPMQAGRYRFQGALTPPEVLRMLVRGQVVTQSVTLIEGLTLAEAAEQLARQGFGDRDTFLELMRSPKLIADLDPEAQDLEGYLFPDTYSFAEGARESEIIEAMVQTFRRRYERDVRSRIPAGTTLRQIVTLASIVEKEAQKADERPVIAGVYRNRLDRGIGLMADPTVIYALKRAGVWNGNIRRADLRIDSPYNTYRYAGLPPGPIAAPGRASVEAALRPSDDTYLYFVSRNDGTHVFANTYAEHLRNVQIWQVRVFRDRTQ